MQVNNISQSKFRYLQNFKWKNSEVFSIHDDKNIVFYNYKNNTYKKIFTDQAAKNTEIHLPTEQVAFTINNQVYVVNQKGKKYQVTKHKQDDFIAGQSILRSEFGIKKGLFWSDKGNYLVFYQKDESQVHDYPLLNINEYPGSLNSIKYPMAGQASEKVSIGIHNLNKKKTKFIHPRNGDENYLTNVSISPNEDFLYVAEVSRSQKEMWMNQYDLKTGKFIKTLFKEESNTWVEPKHALHFLNNSNGDFLYISEKDEYSHNMIEHYNSNGELINIIGPGSLMIKEILKITPDNNIIFKGTGADNKSTHLYQMGLNKKLVLLTKTEGVHNGIPNDKGDLIYNNFSNIKTPNKCVIINNEGKEEKILLNAENPLNDYNLGLVYYHTLEGGLNTRTIVPKNYNPKSSEQYPVLIYVYGGPHAQLVTNSWLDAHNLWMHWMANQGYIVFSLDNRGSGNNNLQFEKAIHRQLGKLELEDQIKGVEFLKSNYKIDSSRIAVHGWSYGGFMTLTMLTEASEIFNCGVAGGPVTDWKFYEIMYGERYMDTPKENPDGYKNSSIIEKAEKLEAPLLLIHGTSDDVVVMQHNYALVKKFIEVNKQVDFFPYPMHKHNVTGKDRAHLMTKVLNYVLINNQ